MVVPFAGALSFFVTLWVFLPNYLKTFILFALTCWVVGVVLHVLMSL